VETKVVLRHRASGVEAHAGERRSQPDNRRVALRRMRLALAVAVRCAAGEPSPLWRSRVSGGRISCSPEGEAFPAMLAEALDGLAEAGWEPRAAAARLGCTATQVIRFVAEHPQAKALLDREREARGLSRLRG